MSANEVTPITGGCLCGAVRYRAEAAPLLTGHCYCVDCRRTSGTGHGTHVMLPEDRFSLTGELQRYDKPADSGNMVSRHFCPTCGSAIHSTNDAIPGAVFVRASSLDDPNVVTPQALVFTSRAATWEPLDPELPSFPEMPPEQVRKAMAGRD